MHRYRVYIRVIKHDSIPRITTRTDQESWMVSRDKTVRKKSGQHSKFGFYLHTPLLFMSTYKIKISIWRCSSLSINNSLQPSRHELSNRSGGIGSQAAALGRHIRALLTRFCYLINIAASHGLAVNHLDVVTA